MNSLAFHRLLAGKSQAAHRASRWLGYILALPSGLALTLPSASRAATVDVSARLPAEAPPEYCQAVAQYFHLTERALIAAVREWRHYDDLPVVFWLAVNSDASARDVLELRRKGKDWYAIFGQLGVSPRELLLETDKVVGAPFLRVYERLADPNRKVLLTDQDIVNLANLKFLTKHYQRTPLEIMEHRANGEEYPALAATFAQAASERNPPK
jgi:hypothetical protein